MVLKTSFTFLIVATLAVFSTHAPQVEAHSWVECVDWRFNGKRNDWTDKGGKCHGYARRFPLGKPFGTLSEASPNRHYMQDKKNPNNALPCSNGRAGSERGSDETRAPNPTHAYDKDKNWGPMTVTNVGNTLCVRWPSKTHADESGVPKVQIYLAKNTGKDISQTALFKYKVADLPFSNCNKGNKDKRPCGGCFKVPVRASGIYLMQWRWMLNKNEWYTSCADIQIGRSKK
ncbi:hypothetical protein BGZ68_005714 [Mortierella alpina]|nr:hypothetical protein BGZ68_005714 [Mortierella alpina]